MSEPYDERDDLLEAVLTGDGAYSDLAKCPRCEGHLHAYAASCFGCDDDRGSGFARISAQIDLIEGLDDSTVGKLIESGVRNGLTRDTSGADDRESLYRMLHVASGSEPVFNEGSSIRLNYVGGLEQRPHSEYGTLSSASGRFTFVGQSRQEPIIDVPADRVLGASAHPALDDVLGGRTFGFYSGGFAFFDSIKPTEGGMLKLVFADPIGEWRVAVFGNRTGITDARYHFEGFQQMADWVRQVGRWWATRAEWSLGPAAYAESIGFTLPPFEQAVEVLTTTKVCPDCAETVQAAARICRFCRYEFAPAG